MELMFNHSRLVEEIDSDIWKGMYNPDTAEDPEEVDMYYDRLIRIVRDHMRKNP